MYASKDEVRALYVQYASYRDQLAQDEKIKTGCDPDLFTYGACCSVHRLLATEEELIKQKAFDLVSRLAVYTNPDWEPGMAPQILSPAFWLQIRSVSGVEFPDQIRDFIERQTGVEVPSL